MSFNTFGKIFRFTTWGESHGPAIGCVIDGCPPNIPLSEKDIQEEIDAYEALIPDGDNLKATMLIMYTDVHERKIMLNKLCNLENSVWLSVNNSKKIDLLLGKCLYKAASVISLSEASTDVVTLVASFSSKSLAKL